MINGPSFGNYNVPCYKYDLGQPTTWISDPLHTIQLKHYPNPFSSQLTIHLEWESSQPGESVQFRIYDVLGQLVHQSFLNTMLSTPDLSHLQDGLYYIELFSGQTVRMFGTVNERSE